MMKSRGSDHSCLLAEHPSIQFRPCSSAVSPWGRAGGATGSSGPGAPLLPLHPKSVLGAFLPVSTRTRLALGQQGIRWEIPHVSPPGPPPPTSSSSLGPPFLNGECSTFLPPPILMTLFHKCH